MKNSRVDIRLPTQYAGNPTPERLPTSESPQIDAAFTEGNSVTVVRTTYMARGRVEYSGLKFDEGFRADLLIENEVIVEIKCVERLNKYAQDATPDLLVHVVRNLLGPFLL